MKSQVSDIVFPYSDFNLPFIHPNMRLKGIYVIWHISCECRLYIGSTKKSFRHRWTVHIRQLLDKRHHSLKLQRVVDKYGIEGLRFQIIHLCPASECELVEDAYIKEINPYYNNDKYAGRHKLTPKNAKKAQKVLRLCYYGKKHKPCKESTKRIIASTKKNKRKILKYNLKGIFVYEYECIMDGVRDTKGAHPALIGKCLRGIRLTHAGFIWLDNRNDRKAMEIAHAYRTRKNHNKKRVIIVDLLTNKRYSFISLRKASAFLGVTSALICNAIKKDGLYLCYKIFYDKNK